MKKKKLLIFAGSVVGLIIGYILLNPVKFGICHNQYSHNGYTGCFDDIKNAIGGIIELFSIAFLIVSIILFFVSEDTIKSWLNFIKWWLPLSVIIIVFSSVEENWMVPYPSMRTITLFLSLVIFLIASISIVIWNARKK
jgi:hypothetical protein